MAITARHTTTLALAYALSAAESGFPVIPLSPTKLPALRSPHRDESGTGGVHPCRGECGLPGHGVHDATTDPAGVRALFAAAPWATGYGIACGRAPHHLIGVDLDVTPTGRTRTGESASASAGEPTPDSVAALQQLAFQHLFTLPETVVVLTPSGGRHIWLSGPAGVTVPNSAGRLAPGIDVRGAGGYLVGPGSVTARGAYRLAPGSAGLTPAPCPRALLRLLTPPERGRHAGPGGHRGGRPAQGHGLVQFVLAAHEGQRNTRLFWAACRAYEHGFGDSLAETLVDAAVRTGLTEHEARATIASASRLTAGPADAA
ncbi:bifunctional DNA primase/polymerase [Streptomyces niveus]|uniref:bifunctional DNA primase/polymerase n=1 Tax=Streptomyces niveus TaxID=193462 RepID=UPI00344F7358